MEQKAAVDIRMTGSSQIFRAYCRFREMMNRNSGPVRCCWSTLVHHASYRTMSQNNLRSWICSYCRIRGRRFVSGLVTCLRWRSVVFPRRMAHVIQGVSSELPFKEILMQGYKFEWNG